MTQTIQTILEQVLQGQELTLENGYLLAMQRSSEAQEAIRQAADHMRRQLVGETVTYVVNRNVNFTNICEQHCSFCAFRRDDGEAGAFWLTLEQILAKAAEAVQRGATEICMQGGLNPQAKLNGRSLNYYLKIVEGIKEAFPALHIHAFSPQEIQFIAREDDLTYIDVILALKDVGVGSMPGTAAEVLDDGVRKVLCPEKINTETWLEIVSLAHRVGLPTTSTLLSGHIETPEQQIRHLDKLRSLQKRSLHNNHPAGVTEFILLPFVGQEAPKPLRRRVGRDQPVLQDALHLTAIARLYLGKWIINHQPSWVKLGLGGATQALQCGCNDLGGTLMEEHITSMAGAQGGTCMDVADLQAAISSINRSYQQRDTLYQPISFSRAVTKAELEACS